MKIYDFKLKPNTFSMVRLVFSLMLASSGDRSTKLQDGVVH